MIIAETRTFPVGPFTVHQRPRLDNPAWAQYLVFLGKKLVGASFSLPDLGCCEWLRDKRGVYASPEDSQILPRQQLRGAAIRSRKK